MDSSTSRIVIGLRLGVPICAPHECVCGAAVDCKESCRKAVGRSVFTAQFGQWRDKTGADSSGRSMSSGAGIFVAWRRQAPRRSVSRAVEGGRCLVWDFTCPDTFAASHLNRAVTGAGADTTEAEAKKKLKYSRLSATYRFRPVAMESAGAVGEDAADFLQELGRRIAAVTGEPRSTEFLLQRLSVAVQRGNAACVLGACSDDSGGF